MIPTMHLIQSWWWFNGRFGLNMMKCADGTQINAIDPLFQSPQIRVVGGATTKW